MELKKSDIPYEYAHCFATAEQCPRCANCLRSLITRLPLEAKDPIDYWPRAIDPRYIATITEQNPCRFFRSTTPKIYARGMTRLYDEVPGKVLLQVKSQVQHQAFSCRTFYFRSRKGTRLITPKEQAVIAQIFSRLCPNVTPVFDEMVEAYVWEDD